MELSEEEIAIETLTEVASDDFDTLGDDISPKMAQNILNVIDKKQKEIEEKRIIIFAGAEKVKQLEKGNRSLMESRIKWKSRYYKEKAKNKDYISNDKIREIKNIYENEIEKDGILTKLNSYDLLRAVINRIEDLLEEQL